MEFDPIADIFPLMSEDDLSDLANDIAEHGLHEPIWTYQGKIIDGRNRYLACQRVEVEPTFREWNGIGSLVGFVVSLNLRRRHLSSSQRAMIALAVERIRSEEARKHMALGGTHKQGSPKIENPIYAAKDAAQVMEVSTSYVHDAKRIQREDPALAEQVRAGEVSIPAAIRSLPKPEPAPFTQSAFGTVPPPSLPAFAATEDGQALMADIVTDDQIQDIRERLRRFTRETVTDDAIIAFHQAASRWDLDLLADADALLHRLQHPPQKGLRLVR